MDTAEISKPFSLDDVALTQSSSLIVNCVDIEKHQQRLSTFNWFT